jgi:hypothetical protein
MMIVSCTRSRGVVSIVSRLSMLFGRVTTYTLASSCRKSSSRLDCLSPDCKHGVVVQLAVCTALVSSCEVDGGSSVKAVDDSRLDTV